MTESLKIQLKKLAERYEDSSFLDEDPSQFLRWYSDKKNAEIASFIAAMLSFGNRKQFIPKIRLIFETADNFGGICEWLKSEEYKNFSGEGKFYRFYSYSDMQDLFCALSKILLEAKTFGDFLQSKWNEKKSFSLDLADIIGETFFNVKIVPKGKNSANKRVYMFLRWMVRTNSPVDLGLWTWYNPEKLVIPLDVHVLQESIRLGLLAENSKPNRKTAIELTEKMKEIWSNDPCRADFALFGLGVDSSKSD